jgi:hypothetical protein
VDLAGNLRSLLLVTSDTWLSRLGPHTTVLLGSELSTKDQRHSITETRKLFLPGGRVTSVPTIQPLPSVQLTKEACTSRTLPVPMEEDKNSDD